MANQQPPPEIGDWVERVIWAGIALFALFKDRILGWWQSRADRIQQHRQHSEQSSLEQVLSSQDKLQDFVTTTLGGLLARIEQGVYKTIEQTRQTNTGLQFDRQHWEQVEERDKDILDWMQRVDDRQEQIERQLVELLREVEEVKRLIRPKKTPGIRDTQQSGKAVS